MDFYCFILCLCEVCLLKDSRFLLIDEKSVGYVTDKPLIILPQPLINKKISHLIRRFFALYFSHEVYSALNKSMQSTFSLFLVLNQ